MTTGLLGWCTSAQHWGKLWHFSWRHISISFRAFLDAAATANANNNFGQFLWLFSLQAMSEIESLALVARPRMQQKALSRTEGIVNHVSCLQELDVVLLLSWTSRLLCLPHSYSFPFSYFFFTEESWIATAVWKKMLSTIVTHSYSRHVWMKKCVVNGLFQNVVYPFRDAYKIMGEGFLGPCCMEGAFTAIIEKRICKSGWNPAQKKHINSTGDWSRIKLAVISWKGIVCSV